MWSSLKLKLEEASFFARQLPAYTRHPKQFLFYLSAFLSSGRSVTFHLQRQFTATGKQQYEKLRDEMLSDEIAKYFVKLRNVAEKEGYPPVVVDQLVVHRDPQTGREIWTQYASTRSVISQDAGAGFLALEDLLKYDWDTHSAAPPAQIEYVWKFPDFPGGAKEINVACREYSDRLWQFVYRFRDLWEHENDKEALRKRMEAAIERFLDP